MMVNRFFHALKSLAGRGKNEDKIELRELVKAHKLMEEAAWLQSQAGFGMPQNKDRVKKFRDKVEEARKLVLDARKHEERLKQVYEFIAKGVQSLPPQLQRQVSSRDMQIVSIATEITPRLNQIAQELIVVTQSVDVYATRRGAGQDIGGKIYQVVEALRYLFTLEEKVSDILKAAEEQSG